MNRISLAMSVAALLIVGTTAFSDDEPKKKEVDNGAPADLIGGYTIISGELFGKKIEKEKIEGTTVRIAKDAIVVTDKDKKEVFVQTYKIDATTKPWKIVMKNEINPYSEKGGETKKSEQMTAKGLLEKKGDTVMLIYALPGGDTPTEFKTKEKQLMFVMKNENKEMKNEKKVMKPEVKADKD